MNEYQLRGFGEQIAAALSQPVPGMEGVTRRLISDSQGRDLAEIIERMIERKMKE